MDGEWRDRRFLRLVRGLRNVVQPKEFDAALIASGILQRLRGLAERHAIRGVLLFKADDLAEELGWLSDARLVDLLIDAGYITPLCTGFAVDLGDEPEYPVIRACAA